MGTASTTAEWKTLCEANRRQIAVQLDRKQLANKSQGTQPAAAQGRQTAFDYPLPELPWFNTLPCQHTDELRNEEATDWLARDEALRREHDEQWRREQEAREEADRQRREWEAFQQRQEAFFLELTEQWRRNQEAREREAREAEQRRYEAYAQQQACFQQQQYSQPLNSYTSTSTSTFYSSSSSFACYFGGPW